MGQRISAVQCVHVLSIGPVQVTTDRAFISVRIEPGVPGVTRAVYWIEGDSPELLRNGEMYWLENLRDGIYILRGRE